MCEKIRYGDINHIGEEIVGVPNVCQKTLDILDDEEYWRKRSCAISCLNFSMNHYGVPFDSNEIPELSKNDFRFLDLNTGVEKTYKYFTKETGWNNYAILEIARSQGLTGKVYNKKFDGKESFYTFLKNFKESGIFISSVDFRGEIDDKIENGSHLVTIIGFSGDKIYVKNPYNTDVYKEYDIDLFVKSMKGNIIFITDKKTEEYLSFSPIRFKNNNLKQNDDYFIRFEVDEGIYARIDKLSLIEFGFDKLLRISNLDLDEKQIEIFKKKIIFIKEYFISNIIEGKKSY